MAGHASWARVCPVFQWKCNEMNNCLEDNNMLYFPTVEPWMQVREPLKVVNVIPPLPWSAQCSGNNIGIFFFKLFSCGVDPKLDITYKPGTPLKLRPHTLGPCL